MQLLAEKMKKHSNNIIEHHLARYSHHTVGCNLHTGYLFTLNKVSWVTWTLFMHNYVKDKGLGLRIRIVKDI